MNDPGPHRHTWFAISYTTEGGETRPILWACSGRARDGGACLATADAAALERERRNITKQEQHEAAEREQRHFRW